MPKSQLGGSHARERTKWLIYGGRQRDWETPRYCSRSFTPYGRERSLAHKDTFSFITSSACVTWPGSALEMSHCACSCRFRYTTRTYKHTADIHCCYLLSVTLVCDTPARMAFRSTCRLYPCFFQPSLQHPSSTLPEEAGHPHIANRFPIYHLTLPVC